MLKSMLAAFAGAMFFQSALAQSDTETETELPFHIGYFFSRTPASLEGYEPPERDGGSLAQAYSFVGREDLTVRYRPDAFIKAECPVLNPNGVQAITDAVQEARIVMINEAHHDPYHRWVASELARELAGNFTVFAAETFDAESAPEDLAAGAVLDLGFYAKEPVYGRQIRRLIEAGYVFANYEIRQDQRIADPREDWRASIIEREEAQAINFIANVLEAHPGQRVLVHVGFSHLMEVGGVGGTEESRWFAARLREKTGLDPLTISQTECSAMDYPENEAIARSPLVDGSETIGAQRFPGGVDLYLGRPPMRFTDGRPDWRYEIGDQPVAVPETLTSEEGRVIIEARAPGEDFEMIPVERLMLYPGETLPLLLPEGEWVLTAWTQDGPLGEPVTVSVPSAP